MCQIIYYLLNEVFINSSVIKLFLKLNNYYERMFLHYPLHIDIVLMAWYEVAIGFLLYNYHGHKDFMV